MGIEIERKFLVNGDVLGQSDAWVNKPAGVSQMTQGYFSTPETLDAGQKASMRVRIEYPDATTNDANCWLNIKSVGTGHTRQEFEYPIPTKDAQELMLLCVGSVVRKHRFIIPHGDLNWEVDIFLDDNDGLIVAEIELPSADHPFELPEWIGEEVTDDLRYTNVALSSKPYKSW